MTHIRMVFVRVLSVKWMNSKDLTEGDLTLLTAKAFLKMIATPPPLFDFPLDLGTCSRQYPGGKISQQIVSSISHSQVSVMVHTSRL